ncbi:MAG: Rpn family recombination-promoting nuclease/putative transposase [Hormoscilla sp.]
MSFHPEKSKKWHSFDGIFLPDSEKIDKPIYFLEVQFQPNEDFYWRFFAEIFAYIGQYKPKNDWLAVAVFATRSLDPGLPIPYQALLPKLKLVYLSELSKPSDPSLGLGIVQLALGSSQEAVPLTKKLMIKARQSVDDVAFQRKVIELIESTLVYKFTELSREEIEAMFALSDLKQTKVYQEGKEEGLEEGKLEGKLEGVPGFLALGLTVEQIARALDLDVEVVQQAAVPAEKPPKQSETES